MERYGSPLLQACYNISKHTLYTDMSILIGHVRHTCKQLRRQFLSSLDTIPRFVCVMSHIKQYGKNLIFTSSFYLVV